MIDITKKKQCNNNEEKTDSNKTLLLPSNFLYRSEKKNLVTFSEKENQLVVIL